MRILDTYEAVIAICDNCLSTTTEEEHRCRADENSCIDGTKCPDYVPFCNCPTCNISAD